MIGVSIALGKVAQQLYQTLRRGQNVEDLHQQVAQRLAQLQEGWTSTLSATKGGLS